MKYTINNYRTRSRSTASIESDLEKREYLLAEYLRKQKVAEAEIQQCNSGMIHRRMMEVIS